MNSLLPDVKRLMRFLAGHTHWIIFGRVYASVLALLLSVFLFRYMPIDMHGIFASLYPLKAILGIVILVFSKWILTRG